MSYFKTSFKSREQLRKEAHYALVQLVAGHIAKLKGDDKELATEAFTMYMSIKIGDTKREDIVAGYLEAIADASA
jgi:hypothetical protein